MILVGIFLIPIIPLVVFNSLFFPFITGKNFAFRLIVEVITGAWVILAVTDTKYRPKKSWIAWALLAFLVVMALADATGIYPYKSFWSNFERMEGYITLLHLGAYFFVLAAVLSTTRLWSWFLNTTIAVSIIMSVYGLLQLAGKFTINQGGVRLDGRLGNATYLAIYVVFHMFLVAYLAVSDNHFVLNPGNTKLKRQKLLIAGLVIIIEGIILYYTATRGAILGFIFGAVLAALLVALLDKTHKHVRKIGLGIVIVGVVVVIGFIGLRNASFIKKSPVLSRFASISVNDKTTESRFILWNMAFKGFKERPILGWGQENFNYVFNKYYNPKLYDQEQWFDRTHNVIFDWLIAGGLLGILTYLGFFISILVILWKKGSSFSLAEKSVLTGMLAGYFIHNLFVFDNLTSYLLFAVGALVYSQSTRTQGAQEHTYKQNRIIAPVMLIVTIAVIYFANVSQIRASYEVIYAISPYVSASSTPLSDNVPFNGDVSYNLAAFKRAIGENSFGSPEIREQLYTAAAQAAQSQTPVTGAQDLANYAVTQGKVQIDRTPKDARYYLLLGIFLSNEGQYNEAIQYLQKAELLSPNKQSIMFQVGAAYAGAKDYPNAVKEFKKAYELDTSDMDAQILYASSAIYSGDNKLADSILKNIDKDTLLNNEQLLQAYYNTKQYTIVLATWKARSEADPTNPQKHLSLAASYLLVKDTKNAILQIQKVEELYPPFKVQGEEYIKQIKNGTLTQ